MLAKAPTAQQLKNLTGNTPPTYRSPKQASLGVAETLDAIDRAWVALLRAAEMVRGDFKTYILDTPGSYSAVVLSLYRDVMTPNIDAATLLVGEIVKDLHKAHPVESQQIMALHTDAKRGMSHALEHPCATSFVPIYIQSVIDKFQELREKLLTPGRYVKKLMAQQQL